MKQVVFEGNKGYLIPIKVVEDKLREKFEVLKDKIIDWIHINYMCCRLSYQPTRKIEKKKDHMIIYTEHQKVTEMLVFKKELLNELFGLKGNILNIEPRIVKNKMVISDIHIYWWTLENYESGIDSNVELYYFFEIKDYETEDLCEVS